MCDTLVVPPGNSATLFAKNSDREPNEAQQVVTLPAADHASGEILSCTYVRIPQARHTHAVLLSKPFWIWGAEMGANEHGVVIGNEAVFTKQTPSADAEPDGLIGMDLLRLALERAQSAGGAVETIVSLLEQWGQKGNCGYTRDFCYDNSFLIADADSAWVLETAGRDWVAQRISAPRSISNMLTLGRDWDHASRGITQADTRVDFAAAYTDVERTQRGSGDVRCQRTQSLLEDAVDASPALLMSYLRDHGDGAAAGWNPATAEARTVCMHAAPAPEAASQTTGSMVSIVGEDSLHFVTGVAAPCTAIFLPMWVDCRLPASRMAPGAVWDDRTLYWQHEHLHRIMLLRYSDCLARWEQMRVPVETEIMTEAFALRAAPQPERQRFLERSIERVYLLYAETAKEFEKEFEKELAMPPASASAKHYTDYWASLTEVATDRQRMRV